MSILVIKHSALGDMILTLPQFHAIRNHHPGERLILLTTKPYLDLVTKTGYFDEVWCDSRPKFWQLGGMLRLIRRIRDGHFSRIYDLQGSQRTRWYFRLLGRPRPEWVGNAPGCSHYIPNPREPVHVSELRRQQLALVGISDPGLPDLSFLKTDIARYGLRSPFALLVPGGSPHRPQKRWPATSFAALSRHLLERGIQPVLIGRQAERIQIDDIMAACPGTVSLYEQTSIDDLASLGRAAALAVGNDTGPMHIIAAAGCPSLVLYSAESDPRRVSPRGDWIRLLQRPSLEQLSLTDVLAALPPARL